MKILYGHSDLRNLAIKLKVYHVLYCSITGTYEILHIFQVECENPMLHVIRAASISKHCQLP